MISPGYFKDRLLNKFGPVAFVLEHCGKNLSVFLFFKLNFDVVFMIIRHLEGTETSGASVGFGNTLLNASYNIFLRSVLTSMFYPRAPTLAAVEEQRKTLCYEEELSDIRKDAKRKEEHLYRIIVPAQSNKVVTPIYTV